MNQDVSRLEETITIAERGDIRDAEDLVGKLFAQKYEVLSMLGRGGMSIVYRAKHTVMDKIVALKILQMHLTRDEISLKRFKQEAQTASNLNHSGVVGVHDCGEGGNGMPYIVMDYVEGHSLAELIKSEGQLELQRFLTIMQQVCLALAHAHEQGIVHRDLKPSNIMITNSDGSEQAKILDFGIAKIISQSSDAAQNLTQTGEVFGSPLYMSPEQCSGSQIDRRSDIYSLGCVMYEALSGKVPHMGDSVIETIHKHVNDVPPCLVAPKVPDEFKQKLELILLRCLAKVPDERYQSMLEVESDLRALSLKSKPGILSALGGAWDLASAKRRASKRSKFPLMVSALLSVSILSTISIVVLQFQLELAEADNRRLEKGRLVQRTISQAQQSCLLMGETARKYFSAIVLGYEDDLPRLKRRFELSTVDLDKKLDKVDELVGTDPDFRRDFKASWRPLLANMPDFFRGMASTFKRNTGMGNMPSMNNMAAILRMSQVVSQSIAALQEMTKRADEIEERHLGQYNHRKEWIRYLSFVSTMLSGSVVVSLAYYFAKGTPQRLRRLGNQVALLRKRGVVAESSNSDDVTDLDNVLQELANALSEAEDREKRLLQKIRNQEKQDESMGIDQAGTKSKIENEESQPRK